MSLWQDWVTSRATVEGNLQNSAPRGSFHNWAFFFFFLLGYSQEEENKLNMSFLPLALPLGEWLFKKVVNHFNDQIFQMYFEVYIMNVLP